MPPIILFIAIWFNFFFSKKSALLWCSLLSTTIFIIMASKIAFLGWGIGIKSWDFTGFSGHSTLSAAVYPTIFFLFTYNKKTLFKIISISLGILLAIIISYSRIILNAHSLSETISGFLIGICCTFCFIRFAHYAEMRKWSILSILFGVILLTGLLHNLILPSHRWVTQIALTLSGHERPYVRVLWHRSVSPTS